MITNAKGNMLEADAEALVNTVNCVGYMGKGIALQFKQAFPENFKAYEKACRAEDVKPGVMFVYQTGLMLNPKYIINFPTKRHWRGKSQLKDIKNGLDALVDELAQLQIKSVAVPPLGCGYGGLDWTVVRPLIEAAFEQLPNIDLLLYAPIGSPDAKTMPVHTAKPNMTVARALFIKLMEKYLQLDYELTLLEIQKLAYFLQEAGEPLKLKYEAAPYGPYADNLNKVLERIEGHFTRGYGDSQSPDAKIELMPGAVQSAARFLQDYPESQLHLERVGNLIEGFETPYSMELLSSVHWVAHHGVPPATDSTSALKAVQAWSQRKGKIFNPEHVNVAWNRLHEQQWVT